MSYSFEKFSEEKDFDFEKHKQEFIDNMDMLKTMSVQEQTLYKKWQEFNKSEKLRSKADKLDQEEEILKLRKNLDQQLINFKVLSLFFLTLLINLIISP